ncbi:hypothetical protein [Nonomuraea sp. NPDC049480]|uniref:hypothetical protein n=1 Tax=Nonomuraea sp. NPDC049480 TaxID=3364353 RepID=UPI00379B69F6
MTRLNRPVRGLNSLMSSAMASVAVMVTAVALAWALFGWPPVQFGLTLVGTVVVLSGLERALFRAGRRRGGRR